MSKVDRAINIYQGYSLAKISALNKKSLAMQYAQCEQIVKLEKSLTKELQTVNWLNRQILDNQLKELKRQETVRYYRLIAHNAKEAIEIIESQSDKLFQFYLIKVYAKPLSLLLQDAKSNLEEISDLNFCSKWGKQIDLLKNQLGAYEGQFAFSDFNTMLSQQELYLEELKKLSERKREYKIALTQVKPYQEEKIKSPSEYNSKGCLVTTICIVAFCLMVFGVNIVDEKNDVIQLIVTFFLIPIAVLIAVVWSFVKKSRNYQAYVKEVEKRNEDNLDKYTDGLKILSREGSDITQFKLDLDATHPYMVAKMQVKSKISNFENVIGIIDSFIPHEENANDASEKFDTLIEEAIKFTIELPNVSTSSIQNRFSIGYNRAGKIINQMVSLGVIGGEEKSRNHKVLIDKSNVDLVLNLVKH